MLDPKLLSLDLPEAVLARIDALGVKTFASLAEMVRSNPDLARRTLGEDAVNRILEGDEDRESGERPRPGSLGARFPDEEL